MNSVELVRSLCKEKGIPIYVLERDLGFANGYIRKLNTFPADRLFAVAEYLGVSPEYLQTGQHPAQMSESGKKYYFDDATAEMAQELFEDPQHRMLMSSSRKLSPEDLQTVQTVVDSLLRKEGKLDD